MVKSKTLIVRDCQQQDYKETWQAMQHFVEQRTDDTVDELWFVEHPPVYTVGQNGQMEHVLQPKDIPVLHVDRGGQVTYHGPGQLVAYFLFDIKRLDMGVRVLVSTIENAVIELLKTWAVDAQIKEGAPGIYVGAAKIGSIGLRIKRGYSYHGLSLNIDMDLEPFSRINPCGYRDLVMTQLREYTGPISLDTVKPLLVTELVRQFGYEVDNSTMLAINP